MAITPWLHYADPTLAPLCRSPCGSNVPISDSTGNSPGSSDGTGGGGGKEAPPTPGDPPPDTQSQLPEIVVTAPAPKRLFGTHWCGPGGAGPPVNDLDAACMSHDQCYDAIGATTYASWQNLSATNAANVKACNQGLCDAARSSNAPGSGFVNFFFTVVVPTGGCN
jgi:hypothetical protein